MTSKKIVITGPESTGKTILAKNLAEYFGVPWVPEFARTYIAQLQKPYVKEDLLTIAKGQIAEEERYAVYPYFFLDTNLLTIKIWSEFRYQNCDRWIVEQMNAQKYDLYLLCKPDIPWEADPQREHPHLREELFLIYKNNLESLGEDYVEISGEGKARTEAAIEIVKDFISIAKYDI